MLAGSASSAQGFAFREDMLDRGPLHTSCPSHAGPEYLTIPVNQSSDELIPVVDKPREYDQEFPVNHRARTCEQSIKEAEAAAKMLRASLLQGEAGIKAKCKYKCDTESGCRESYAAGVLPRQV